MTTTTYWSPNQATIAQVETYTIGTPASVPGSTISATINGKSVTYTTVTGDTAATVATALYNLLNQTTSIPTELTEITFANPSAGVVTATARTPGTPFANVPGTSAGLVLSTGNGWSSGVTTVHTQANQSPSDVNDSLNWLRNGIRQLPQNTDAVVVGSTNIPMLWNLGQLSSVAFSSYVRTQDMTGSIGLPFTNPNGYQEWRQQYFWFTGPAGSVPAGGLTMVLGAQGNGGSGPPIEQYNAGSQSVTIVVLASTAARFLGTNADNDVTILSGNLAVAAQPGESANLANVTVYTGGGIIVGNQVGWAAFGSTLTMNGGAALMYSAPSAVTLANGSQLVVGQDGLTWPSVTAQGGSLLSWQAGGIISNLVLTTSSTLDKSQDARTLIVTSATIDGDTCQVSDPLNAITWTNAVTVKQQVVSGPFTFTGPRTVKVV